MNDDNGNHAHTPGPWRIDEMPGKFRVLGEKREPSGAIHMRFGTDVCEIPFANDGDINSPLSIQERAEAQADARLIAASPAMLDALENITRVAENMRIILETESLGQHEIPSGYFNRAYQAITLAKEG